MDVGSGKILIPDNFPGGLVDLAAQIGMLWDLIKAPLIVPLLQFTVYVCLAMTVMLFVERLYMGIVVILVKLFWKKPEKRYNWEPIRDDLAIGNSAFPLVLIQIPMFNEKEVHNLGMVVMVGNGGDAIVAGEGGEVIVVSLLVVMN
ncbi:putative glucomannan 4-beta-mannosyltransferase [Helianthus annuus]|nr:putative glucomannan 4-beta-mannosyltransferase [Helianthus annuus]KAJ0601324.1 putative glucomannan 4-beta-mannosyltransferase [Helianthus annuus]KAJ0608458.1 putative glucomannan 4-beta-mannosyltransferase [Helianthus annuus]KAJ0768520.1 putative glucomannan 4-beta-mannosyltransferase [Helianthus annuus]